FHWLRALRAGARGAPDDDDAPSEADQNRPSLTDHLRSLQELERTYLLRELPPQLFVYRLRMIESHAKVTQVVFRARLFGLRRRLFFHPGELVGKGALASGEIGLERRNFLFDGLALPHDLGVPFSDLRRHAGELVGKGALSSREIGVERRYFLFDGPALPHDLGVQFSELSTQRIPLPEQVTDVVDKLVCLDDVIEPLPQLAETARKLA